MELLYAYPKGKKKVLTLSYDDGRIADRRLLDILNKNSIKGTFHLNSGKLNSEGYITKEEVEELYQGHEVSAHTVNHPWLTRVNNETIIYEVMQDRANLEEIMGYIIRGMSYPYGVYNEKLTQLLPCLGIEYARTVESTHKFNIPDDFLAWHPTCHHNENILEKAKEFLKYDKYVLFYLWGHSYEFDNDNNWKMIEEFCSLIGNREEIWYATNIQYVEYLTALKNIRLTSNREMAYNPSAISVWLKVNNRSIEIPAGQTIRIVDN